MNYEINNYSAKNYQESNIENLFELSKKNVESRIKQLEDEITTRQQLSDQSLSTLSTHKTRVNEQLRQVRYMGAFGEQRDFSKQIARLEESVIKEMTSCFGDVSKLKERLQEAKEELETEKQKLKLVDSKKYEVKPVIPTPKTNYQFLPQQLNHYLPKYSIFN